MTKKTRSGEGGSNGDQRPSLRATPGSEFEPFDDNNIEHVSAGPHLEPDEAIERDLYMLEEPDGEGVPDTCPKCGAQTKDPFWDRVVIHDIEACAGNISQNKQVVESEQMHRHETRCYTEDKEKEV